MDKSNSEKVWDNLRGRVRRKRIKGENVALNWKKVDFIKWYDEQNKNCIYCKIPQGIFEKIWGPFYGGKRGKILEIDRKDNEGEYSEENCAFACALCNCAKSDKIGYEDFKKIGKVIEKIWREKARDIRVKV